MYHHFELRIFANGLWKIYGSLNSPIQLLIINKTVTIVKLVLAHTKQKGKRDRKTYGRTKSEPNEISFKWARVAFTLINDGVLFVVDFFIFIKMETITVLFCFEPLDTFSCRFVLNVMQYAVKIQSPQKHFIFCLAVETIAVLETIAKNDISNKTQRTTTKTY